MKWQTMMRHRTEIFAALFVESRKARLARLIAGPGVYICDSCIELCSSILEEESRPLPAAHHAPSSIVLPKPREIKEMLDEYVIGHELCQDCPFGGGL